jgi:hypothetical protein
MQTETVAQMWDSYARAVLPMDVGETQKTETRRAFYAGVFALLEKFKNIGENEVSEDAGVAYLEAISVEVTRFYVDVLARRA